MLGNALGFWGRLGVAAIGSSVVMVTMILVVCLVNRGCWTHNFSPAGERKRRKKEPSETDKIIVADPQQIMVKGPNITLSTTPELEPLQFGKLTTDQTPLFAVADSNTLLNSLSTKRDSTYSSMSENSERTSPTNSCRSSAEGSLGSAAGSNAGSPIGGEAQGRISFAIQYVLTNKERGNGKLILDIKEARGLTGRSYMGGACDPYIKIIVTREKRSIRRGVNSSPLHVFRTRTVRHTTEPKFDQSFAMDINRCDLKDINVKFVAIDSDKWVSSTTLGEVIQPLRDIKNLASNPEKKSLSFFLWPPKVDFGEILFGLSYLPTAQRLSVSVIKANKLKHSNVVDNLSEFYPFVRALLISPSGRVLRKKKTTSKNNTDKPIWNETLIFDLSQHKIDHVTFILAVCSRPQLTDSSRRGSENVSTLENNSTSENKSTSEQNNSTLANSSTSVNGSTSDKPHDYSSPVHEKKQEKYLGKVILGLNVSQEYEKIHWKNVLLTPRKVISKWHTLK